jgi:hypothetical protein
MHQLSGGLLLGYHGCSSKVAERLLDGEPFKPSANKYDWLGPGIYFWEANPRRALDFAVETLRRKKDSVAPAVVGAVINLGLCLDLLTKAGLDEVAANHTDYSTIVAAAGEPMPTNTRGPLLNHLDCSVIKHLHQARLDAVLPTIQTVRGVFIEGDPLYATSAFHHKTHIQIAVCDPTCIKGVFRVRTEDMQ